MNISHLVEKIKKGDNKSFEKLYKLTEREVWFTCISFLKNETTAQDIMQETYITAFLKIQSLEKSSQIRSWLNRIAVNKCKNYLKGKGEIQLDDEIFENQAIVDERISIPEEYISDKAKREIILSIMQEVLSDVQYQTVIMHYFNEMTVDEIAEVFECSRGTVLSRLNYSRAKMKTAIEDYENKSGDKLHGVVVVPFFTTIFKEEAKSLAVPNITIKLPNGQTLATSATKGFATGAKSTVSSIVKATATATVKTKVIAVVCGATILAGTSAVGISILAGCNAEKEPTEPSVISSTVQTSTVPTTVPKTTVPKAVKDLVDKGEIKVDKDGNITDVYIYQNGMLVDKLQNVDTFNTADCEQTDADRTVFVEQQKKISGFNAYIKNNAISGVGVSKPRPEKEKAVEAVELPSMDMESPALQETFLPPEDYSRKALDDFM